MIADQCVTRSPGRENFAKNPTILSGIPEKKWFMASHVVVASFSTLCHSVSSADQTDLPRFVKNVSTVFQ